MSDSIQQLNHTIQRLHAVLNFKRTLDSDPDYFSTHQLSADVRYVENQDPDWLAKALRNPIYTLEKRLLLGEELVSKELRASVLEELYSFLKDDNR